MRATGRAPMSQALRAAVPARDRSVAWSLTAIFVAALVLQRFGIPFGDSKVNLVTFVVFAVLGLGVVRGQMVLDARRAAAWLAFATWCLVSGLYTIQLNPTPGLRNSLPSLLHFVGLYLPFAFRFTGTMPRAEVYGRFQAVALFVAGCGILQFLAQLGGISVFSFLDYMPEQYSVEPIFNVVIPLGSTAWMKSNGFFLVEPSVFSQTMAIAIGIELLFFRRISVLCVLAAAMLFSASGTGVLGLALVLALIATTTRALDARLLFGLLAAAGIIALLAIFAFQDVGNVFASRVDEVNVQGSSARLRFITPFLATAEVIDRFPEAIVWGTGPGSSERLSLGFSYSVPTPWKVGFEYGLPGLVLWTVMLVVTLWRRGEAAILLPLLFLFFFAGGYHQFGPAIYVLGGLFALAPRVESRAMPTPVPSMMRR